MDLSPGAETVVDQCLAIDQNETVVIVNDSNDEALIEALQSVLDDRSIAHDYLTYPEPETSGTEPPEDVADAMKEADVFIAPTQKSLSHTRARRDACESGARGATMPGITQEIWTTSLLADYSRVRDLSERVHEAVVGAERACITTPTGTNLRFDIDPSYWEVDTGIIHEPGAFSNLPAGEAFGAPVNTSGTLVIDHFPYAPSGTQVEIEENQAVAVKHPGSDTSKLSEAFDTVDDARNVAEVGIGTNPKATLIGSILQDEKVLGTVHVAFGDNSSMVPGDDPRAVDADLHWDAVCEDPTLTVDGTVLIDDGEPQFLA